MVSLLHRIRLQHVRCLLACAQHGNMRAAAEALAITQPAVTKIIQDLEDIVGQPLMVRERLGVRLTHAGERFVRHARLGVFSLEQALGSVMEAQGAPLRLGVLPSMAPAWLTKLIQSWRRREPQGTLRLVSGRNAELLAQLQRGELDAVLGRLAEPDRMMHLRFEPLWAEPLVVAMRADHPMVDVPLSQWQELACPVVLALPGTAIRQAADDFLASVDAHVLGGVIETLEPEIGRAMAWHEQALWFAPYGAVRDESLSWPLVYQPLPGAAAEAIGLYLPADAQAASSQQTLALTELVHELSLPSMGGHVLT